MATKPNERLAVLAELPPLSSSGARNSAWFLGTSPRVLVAFHVGASSAAGTIRIRRASDADGTGAENASDTVAYGGTSTTGNDVLHFMQFDPTKYATDAKPYLSVQIAAGGTYVSSLQVIEFDPRQMPGDSIDAVNVVDLPDVA